METRTACAWSTASANPPQLLDELVLQFEHAVSASIGQDGI
jgi:hypothetical protein